MALHHGEALSKAGDFTAAKLALEASLKINPGQYPARVLLGSAYFSLHEFTAAQDQLEGALLINTTPEAQIKLAEIFLAQNKYEEARQLLEAAVKLRRDSTEAYDLLAQAHKGLGNNRRAQQAQSRAKILASQQKPTPHQ